jgi:excisionase family DNA binding protein
MPPVPGTQGVDPAQSGAPPSGGPTRLLTADRQVPKSHVYRLTRDGRIPAVRLGRYYRYRVAAIEAWEHDNEAVGHAA